MSTLYNVKNEGHKKFIHNSTINILNMIRTRLVRDGADFRCSYLRKLRSICNNLPRPNVSILNNYIYV